MAIGVAFAEMVIALRASATPLGEGEKDLLSIAFRMSGSLSSSSA